jgi:hypothetical protein
MTQHYQEYAEVTEKAQVMMHLQKIKLFCLMKFSVVFPYQMFEDIKCKTQYYLLHFHFHENLTITTV